MLTFKLLLFHPKRGNLVVTTEVRGAVALFYYAEFSTRKKKGDITMSIRRQNEKRG